MLTGKVLRFDEVRGYGFIAPDNGTEDVFVHANDFGSDKTLVGPGSIVEFEVEEGERGLKASWVRLVKASGASRALRAAATGVTRATAAAPAADDDDSLCDVLLPTEFSHEVTDALIEAVPALTGAQIVAARERLLQHARTHGWVENPRPRVNGAAAS